MVTRLHRVFNACYCNLWETIYKLTASPILASRSGKVYLKIAEYRLRCETIRRMRISKPLLSAFMTVCMVVVSSTAAQASSTSPDNGKLTEVQGHVFKRAFKDERKEVWSEPVAAQVGDLVSDGMQVGTGEKSWTQCTWRHVTARAWENSVYMVSPKQKLVYLVGGELLFNLDKHRPDKAPYSIWTKYLHATVRGTTLLVQAKENGSRVSVLEGTVDVLNRLDNSVVTLTPGVVYEVTAKDSKPEVDKTSFEPGITDGAYIANQVSSEERLGLRGTLEAFAGKIDLTGGSGIDLGIAEVNPVVLFDSLASTTIATLTSLNQVVSHPLLTDVFQTPLSSMSLIKTEMPLIKVDLINHPATGVSETLKGVSVRQVPILTAYSIGSDLLSRMKEREVAFQHWAPSGIVSWSRDARGPRAEFFRGSISDVTSKANGLTGVLDRGGVVQLTQFNSMGANLQNASRSLGVATSNVLGGTNGAVGGVVNGALGGVRGAVGSTLGGGSGAIGGVGNTVGGLGGSLGGVLGGGGLGGLLK